MKVDGFGDLLRAEQCQCCRDIWERIGVTFSHEADLGARNTHTYFLTVPITIELGLVGTQSEFLL